VRDFTLLQRRGPSQPGRESVTAKITPIMRLNIGGPEFGHWVLVVGGV
jgi:hypothetical protein